MKVHELWKPCEKYSPYINGIVSIVQKLFLFVAVVLYCNIVYEIKKYKTTAIKHNTKK